MRIHALLLLLLPASALFAQQAPPAAVSCSVEVVAPTDGSRALAAERYADAETFYAAQMKAKPSITVYAGLVDSQIQLNQVDEAVATAKQAVAALPASGEAQALLGDAELRASHIEEATAAYIAAIKLDKCSARAHFGSGRIEDLYSRHASAQKQYAVAHRLTPANVHISEVTFATLPPALHAKGLRNILASAKALPPAHRQHLEQQAALLEAGAICRPAQMDGAKIPLTPIFFSGVQPRDYALRVTGGSSTAVNLEMDSTAPGIVLISDDAKKLNVKPAIAGQDTPPYLGYVDSLQVGPMQLGKCAVSVVPDIELAHRYSVISPALFRDFKLHLDWVSKFMTLTPFPGAPIVTAEAAPLDAGTPDGEQQWSRALIDDSRILVPALVEKRPVGLVMVDTSTTLNMLSPSAAEPFKPSADQTINVEGVSGNLVRLFRTEGGAELRHTNVIAVNGVAAGNNIPIKRVGDNRTLVFAGKQPPDLTLFSFDISAASHTAGLELGGIIGFTVLHQFYVDIDYRNGLLNLTYDIGYPQRAATMRSE